VIPDNGSKSRLPIYFATTVVLFPAIKAIKHPLNLFDEVAKTIQGDGMEYKGLGSDAASVQDVVDHERMKARLQLVASQVATEIVRWVDLGRWDIEEDGHCLANLTEQDGIAIGKIRRKFGIGDIVPCKKHLSNGTDD